MKDGLTQWLKDSFSVVSMIKIVGLVRAHNCCDLWMVQWWLALMRHEWEIRWLWCSLCWCDEVDDVCGYRKWQNKREMMWAKRPLALDTPTSAIICIHLATPRNTLRSDFLKSATFSVKRGSDGHFRYPIVRGNAVYSVERTLCWKVWCFIIGLIDNYNPPANYVIRQRVVVKGMVKWLVPPYDWSRRKGGETLSQCKRHDHRIRGKK